MVLFGLLGVAYCGYKVYQAWQGKAGIPIGTIIGGALGGLPGAAVGNAVAPETDGKKQVRPRPNVGGLIFWGFCLLVWVGTTVGALTHH